MIHRFPPSSKWAPAVVLLEIIIALAIFISAAMVVHAALITSLRSVQRAENKSHAVNLALSKMAELRIFSDEIFAEGPTEYETDEDPSLEGWYWQVEVESTESFEETVALQRVTVTITNPEKNAYCRLVELLPPLPPEEEVEE